MYSDSIDNHMEVLGGPTFAIDVSSSSPATSTPGQLDGCAGVYHIGSDGGLNVGYGIGEQHKLTFQAEDSSENSSSSIGVPDDSENEVSGTDAEKDEDDEVQSKFRAGLGSFDSLEDSLPFKRGLSSHFSGKSKSFADLSQVRQVNEVKELQKAENPFNKRRRLLIATKLARKSFYSWSNPKSMPLLTLEEDEDEEEDEKVKPDSSSPSLLQSPSLSSSSSSLEEKRQEDGEKPQLLKEDRLVESYHAKMRLRLRSFNKRGCFSLADLSEHDVHD